MGAQGFVTPQLKTFALGLSVSALILVSFFGGALADRVFVIKPLDALVGRRSLGALPASTTNRDSTLAPLLTPGDTVADVAEQASQSVVTVAIKRQEQVPDPFSESIFGLGFRLPNSGRVEEVQRDIGTGFVADESGLIITNRHVVSDLEATYLVIDKDNNEYTVSKIYRDPTNDLAILKVDNLNLPPLPLGDSEKIRVGQSVIAIGTALGEFRHTVTTGVVSGLVRGIEAGDMFGRRIESIEGVIQTDAAINPGNSGGPLLDSAGSVIGVSVAVSAGAENIGFALPINVVKASIDNFNRTGQFDRPFMGIRYQTIYRQAALINDVPQGAYLVEVVAGSVAAEAGLQEGDIITEFDGQSITDQELSGLINSKKIGDRVTVKYWRAGEEQRVEVTLRGSGG
jgi:serine protease Do